MKSDNWKIIDRDEDTFSNAMSLVSKHNIHLWDAVIAACMKEKDFEKIEEIKVTVPF